MSNNGERVYAISRQGNNSDTTTYSYEPFSKQISKIHYFKNGVESCSHFSYEENKLVKINTSTHSKNILTQLFSILNTQEKSLMIENFKGETQIQSSRSVCADGVFVEPVLSHITEILYTNNKIREAKNIYWNKKLVKNFNMTEHNDNQEIYTLVFLNGDHLKIKRLFQ